MNDTKRFGIFGGSFDPVHLGHLILAEQCRERAHLDQIVWIPASTSPAKPEGPRAKSRQRLEMLQLATAGHDQFQVSDVEIRRGDISYTIDTLKALREEAPTTRWFLLIGGDSLNGFPHWRAPEEICQLATPLVANRPGIQANLEILEPFVEPDRFDEIKQAQIELPLIDISSRSIRQLVSEKRSIRYMTPRPVEKYIDGHELYQSL